MISSPLNQYGDVVIPTTGCHGSDISTQRMDDLDRNCLSFIKKRLSEDAASFIAVDIGGGSGAQSKRMAELGANIFFVDLSDQAEAIEAFNAHLGRAAIKFYRGDVREISSWPSNIGCVYSQRMLNYLPYRDALALLTRLKTIVLPQTKFFLSTGGLDTEYGAQYADRGKPIEERFTVLPPAMANKHNITSPICLYTEDELKHLVERAGLSIDHSWTSPFGNPKVVAFR
ncbi:MAG: class I SAM-dependent methyltransferase [Alphaproteobacteria bacterium]|nr:class I SAM-dependent methyltransferase [Alphaproteobacteria bacterium]